MYQLNLDLQRYIYQFDNTYYLIYDRVMTELLKRSWNDFHMYYTLLPEELELDDLYDAYHSMGIGYGRV